MIMIEACPVKKILVLDKVERDLFTCHGITNGAPHFTDSHGYAHGR